MKTFSTFLFSLWIALPMGAATLHVDGTTCTLADAIVAANTDIATGGCPQGDSGEDTLVLDADLTLSAADPTSTLHGSVRAGLPDVTDDLTITAGLGSVIRRDPTFTCDDSTLDPIFRFLQLESGSLTLEGLVFENGCFVSADLNNQGGGIRAAASTELTLDDVTVSTHGVFLPSSAIQGGFLYTEGDRLSLVGGSFDDMTVEVAISLQGGALFIADGVVTTLQGTSFSNLDLVADVSLQGGAIYSRGPIHIDGASFEQVGWVASGGGIQGGAIYSSAGTLVIQGSSFRLFDGTSQSGSTTQGGAIYANNDALVLTDSVFSDLDLFSSGHCIGGAVYSFEDGPYERLIFERLQCQSDGSVAGVAAYFLSFNIVFRDCLFRDNEGRTAQTGFGGAINGARFELIERCAFINNRLIPSLPFVNPEVQGGAVYAGQIDLMRNTTFSGNLAQAGNGAGVNAASAFGGALYLSSILTDLSDTPTTSLISSTTSVISSTTFVDNQAIGGQASSGFSDGQGFGGGLYVKTNHIAEVIGSILAGNTVTEGDGTAVDEDCFADGGMTSFGYNIVKNPGLGCGFSAFGDITGIDPNLHPVDDYGCAIPLPDGSCIPTAAIDQTSWAIDWSSCAEMGIGDDGRGLQRRQDIVGVLNLTADACDSGAFEARDSDGDGITDVPDLCPDVADPDQSDSDDDQVGDACDACQGDDASGDSDGDLVCDDSDICPGSDDSADADLDDVPDGCDLCDGDDTSGDSDGDGICDDSDVCPGSDDSVDTDSDGVPDGCDVCVGNDASGDSDGDGICDDSDAAVGDRVWLDDGNGVQDGGEPGVVGVTVHLYSSSDALLDTTITDGDGAYGFSPGPGSYYLEFVLPADTAYAPRNQGDDDSIDSDVNAGSGTTSIFTLVAGQTDSDHDAGLEPAVIGNRVWLDTNADGLQQSGEPGLSGITVRLLNADSGTENDTEGSVVATTRTGTGGVYGFLNIPTGAYRIEVVPPAGHVFSAPDAGDGSGGDLIDSDIDPSTGRSPIFSYQATSASQSWDAGLSLGALFSDGFESGDLSAWTGGAAP